MTSDYLTGTRQPAQPSAAQPAGGQHTGVAGHRPRLRRDPANKIIAGVAAGIAEHLRVPPVAVRVAFVGLLGANGLGALLYVAYWAVLPVADRDPGPPGAGSGGGRRGGGRGGRTAGANPLQVAALVALAAGVILLQVQLDGIGLNATLVVLVGVVALGAGIIWHQADPTRRHRPGTSPPADALLAGSRQVNDAETERDRRRLLLRVVGGGLLVILGIIGILGFLSPIGRTDLAATGIGLLFAVIALAGLVVALAPLLARVFGQLREERVARIREQERAEVAAIVHDQVLHTLALIQRNAGDSTSVLRLARGQERSLRNWLYKPAGSPRERFAAALEQAAAEVEDGYAVTVETVVVGDTDNDGRVAALVAATREALVNAARHAKVATISLYAEAEADRLSVYVRDRGVGFDPSTVDGHRHGLRGSIIGRMRRNGGTAHIRSELGRGTEVELAIPLSPPNSRS